MTRCPHCFHQLTPDRYAFMCASGRCPERVDPEASAIHGAAVSVAPWQLVPRPPQASRSWAPTPPPCPSCSAATTQVCPDCRYRLPAEWRSGDSLCIAMAGARATGKSVYVGVLVKLMAQLAERLGTTLAPSTPATQVTYQSVYERALFEQRGLLESTPAARTEASYQREPLIYSLGVVDGRRRFVVIRDVAGEDLESGSGDPRHLAFFSHADGVIFMFDPLRVPEIRDQLHDLIPAELITGGDPMAVLTTLLRLVGSGPASIAVVLSKFDAMQALSSVEGTAWNKVMSNAGAAFLRDGGVRDGRYDEEDGQLLHLEVRSLLQRLGAASIVSALERPHRGTPINHRFFAVSALGEPADGLTLHVRGITPFRCLDPFRWLSAATP